MAYQTTFPGFATRQKDAAVLPFFLIHISGIKAQDGSPVLDIKNTFRGLGNVMFHRSAIVGADSLKVGDLLIFERVEEVEIKGKKPGKGLSAVGIRLYVAKTKTSVCSLSPAAPAAAQTVVKATAAATPPTPAPATNVGPVAGKAVLAAARGIFSLFGKTA